VGDAQAAKSGELHGRKECMDTTRERLLSTLVGHGSGPGCGGG